MSVTVLEHPVQIRLHRRADRRRYRVTRTATCLVCVEGIAYLCEPGVWLHRFTLKMDNRDLPASVRVYDHAARPGSDAP